VIKLIAPRFVATLELIRRCLHQSFALDIGCGKNPYIFHDTVENYVGLDIDIKTLMEVSRDIPSANLICASSPKVPFRNDAFDMVICTETSEHLKKPEETISEISRLLIKGGFAVISVPSLNLPRTLILWVAFKTKKISKKPYRSLEHKREYAKFKITPHFEKIDSLFELFRERGLRLKDILTVQSLQTKPKIVYERFLSKIEQFADRGFSKIGTGHYTIFRIEKE